MYRGPSIRSVWIRRTVRSLGGAVLAGGILVGSAGVAAAGPTDLDQTQPIIWVLLAISAIGAIVTWGVMSYALWKYRDPATRRRRYG